MSTEKAAHNLNLVMVHFNTSVLQVGDNFFGSSL